MGYTILKGEGAIRHKIRDLFSSRTRSHRRLIMGPLTDLVPLDHLPDIHNVELYSWGRDSFPDPAPLATLSQKGVRINWVNPTRLRLYWVKGRGAVIGPGFEPGPLLAEVDREDQDYLALYLDAAASMVVDEVLSPLALDPAGRDIFGDCQENCNLLWRLAEGITLAGAIIDDPAYVSPGLAYLWPEKSPRPRPALTALERRQQASDLEGWYHFLAEETQKPDGLLCFYERPRPQQVERCCRFLLGLSGLLDG
jgi:hypothetical protein